MLREGAARGPRPVAPPVVHRSETFPVLGAISARAQAAHDSDPGLNPDASLLTVSYNCCFKLNHTLKFVSNGRRVLSELVVSLALCPIFGVPKLGPSVILRLCFTKQNLL